MPKSKKAAAKKPEGGASSGAVAQEAIRAGKSNEEALAAVQKACPGAKTTLATINWYRNRMRSAGEKVPTAREVRRRRKADPLD